MKEKAVLRKILFGTVIFLAVLNLFIVLLNHYYFRTVALDYAVYNFAFFDFAHLRISPCPVYLFNFPVTFLQDHFSLTLFFLSPLYWITLPLFGSYSLLIIQWCFILAGSWATYRIILLRGNNIHIALLAVLYYFLLFGRYSSYREDVNLAIIGSAMIPVLLLFFEQGRTRLVILTFLFLLLNREDYALWLFFLNLFLLAVYWKDAEKRKLASGMLVASLIFFLLVFSVIIPALEDENKKYALFDFTAVGSTPKEAFLFVISHPLEAIRLLFVNHSDTSYYNGVKENFYLVYMVSGGVLLFMRPWYLIPFIPILAKKMYDDNPLRWSIETYYSVEFVSIMPVLVFMVILQLFRNRGTYYAAITVCTLTAAMTVYKMLVPPPNPIVGESNKYNVVHPDFYKSWVETGEVREVLTAIPADAPVSGSCRLLPHLAYRKKVYYFPKIDDARYVVLFKREDYYPLSKEEYHLKVDELRKDPAWFVRSENADVMLFERRGRGVGSGS